MTSAAPPVTLAVCDIDGVLADVTHRLHHLETRPKNWRGFFAAADRDPVLEPGVALVRELSQQHEVLYLTGRPAHLRRATLRWLARHALPPGDLVMRRAGDFRPAREVKLAELDHLSEQRAVDIVVDDDPAVVAALRAAGYAVLHADWATRTATLQDAQEREGRT